MSKATEAAKRHVSDNIYENDERSFLAGVEWLLLYIETQYPALYDFCGQPDQDPILLRREVLE